MKTNTAFDSKAGLFHKGNEIREIDTPTQKAKHQKVKSLKPAITDFEHDKSQEITLKLSNKIITLKKELQTDDRKGLIKYLSEEELSVLIDLTDDEKQALAEIRGVFPFKITHSYARLFKDCKPDDPLRRIVVPSMEELIKYDDDDKVDVHKDEADYQPVDGIIHRYSNKLLFIPTLECFGHCRFCFRAGKKVKALLEKDKIDTALEYIRQHTEIRDVIMTGGDPLTLSYTWLDYILNELKKIRHVEIIRVGTRAPAYAPEFITDQLIKILSGYKPIVMILSFMHAREITDQVADALHRLSDAGMVLLQQGPILNRINDSTIVLKELYEKLARHRVMAYYANYGAPTPGTRHFVVYRDRVRKLINGLENSTSGFCVPHIITLNQDNNKTRSMN